MYFQVISILFSYKKPSYLVIGWTIEIFGWIVCGVQVVSKLKTEKKNYKFTPYNLCC